VSGWYPLMLKLNDRKCVVVGGGAVGERKTAGLLDSGADVVVVSPTATPALQEWAAAGRIRLLAREAADSDLEGAVLVFAATDQPSVNARIIAAARSRGIPVNSADDGDNGDFAVPAVLRRGDLHIAVSAAGASPALSSRVIRELSERYGAEYGEYTEALRYIRSVVKAEIADAAERRLLLRTAAAEDALEEWRNAPWLGDKDKLLARLRQRAKERKG